MSSITRVRTRTAVPTREESLALVRNLLRTAISSIVYLRNIFPEHCFRDRTLTGINIKALIPEVEDAKLLITWLEKGVFDALEKKYLQSIIFGIYTDPDKDTELVESYNFTISYDKNGHSVDLQGQNVDKQFSAPAKITKDQIKQSTLTMMRHLTILSQTLEPLPTDRYLTLKLLYQPHTPENYEPPFFKHANPDDPLRFKVKPTKIKVGSVMTPYHFLSLKVKTTGGIIESQSETSTVATSYEVEDDSQPLWESDEEVVKERESKDLYPLIKSVVIKKKIRNFGDIVKEFPHLSPTELQVHFKKLKHTGVIKDDEESLYTELVRILEDEMTVSNTSIRQRLGVDKQTATSLMKKLQTNGIVAKGRQKVKKVLKQKEIQEQTSVLGKRKRVTAKAPKSNQENIEFQKPAKKKQKCSVVVDPILQED